MPILLAIFRTPSASHPTRALRHSAKVPEKRGTEKYRPRLEEESRRRPLSGHASGFLAHTAKRRGIREPWLPGTARAWREDRKTRWKGKPPRTIAAYRGAFYALHTVRRHGLPECAGSCRTAVSHPARKTWYCCRSPCRG